MTIEFFSQIKHGLTGVSRRFRSSSKTSYVGLLPVVVLIAGSLAQVTRARITQIMNLNLLAPELQEGLLFRQPVEGGRDAVTLKGLQEVCLEADWGRQALTH